MYCGYVTTIKNIRKHSNADRLQCIEVFGQNVIVDLTYKEGQKVVFFPSDGQLSVVYSSSHSFSHEAALASLGIRQSPRGLSDTDPTLGPSGRQERLNCC